MKTCKKSLLLLTMMMGFILLGCNPDDVTGFTPGNGNHETPEVPADPVDPGKPDEPEKPTEPETPTVPEEEQDASISGTPIDSRWEVSREQTTSADFSWLKEGVLYANSGEGKEKAGIKVCSDNDSKFNYSILNSNGKNAIAVSGFKKNDYILFRVPMENLPAGTDVDFFAVVNVSGNNAPKDWIFEYYEDGKWNAVGKAIEIKYVKNYNHPNIFRSFTIKKAVEKRGLRMRLRVSSDLTSSGNISAEGSTGSLYFGPEVFQVARVLTYPAGKFPAVKDSKKVMVLGNSYTYFYATSWMLKEIARSQGHQLEMAVSARDGYGLKQHLDLPLSKAVIEDGNYDYAILQDNSIKHSAYITSALERAEILADTKNMKDKILAKSPNCHIILENTWASGSVSKENLIEGCKKIAEAAGIPSIAPHCAAFDAAKGSHSLFYTDGHHPGQNGAYLKSCVNYLVLYKTKFDENVSDCGIDPATAKALRKVAEDIVLGTK